MEPHVHYETVTEALRQLKLRGYTLDFNLHDDSIVCNEVKHHPEDFEIVEVYRYEGDTDPADEATVYAIESKAGLKGVLIAGYGMSSDEFSAGILKKIRKRPDHFLNK